MVEGEATQESTAPEGAPTSPQDAPASHQDAPMSQQPEDAVTTAEGESPAAEVEAAPQVEAFPATTLDWSHLRGFQSVEAPAGEIEDYPQELAKELAARAARFARSVDESIVLSSDGLLRWLGDPVARVVSGDDLLHPRAVLLADEALGTEDRAAVETRAALWLAAHVRKVLGPLLSLAEGVDLPDGARVIAGRIAEALGVLDRERVRNEVRSLDQTARGALRKLGVRFGSLYIYVPALLKPGARGLCTLLWTLKRGTEAGADRLLAFAAAGRTSFANEGLLSPDSYRVAGFRLSGERVVRVDIIERLSDLIRAAIPDHMRSGSRPASEANGFVVTPQMTSLTGCSGEAFSSILRSLGFEPVKVSKAAFEAANRRAPVEPIKPAVVEAAAVAAETTEEGAEEAAEALEAQAQPEEPAAEEAVVQEEAPASVEAEAQEPGPQAGETTVEETAPEEASAGAEVVETEASPAEALEATQAQGEEVVAADEAVAGAEGVEAPEAAAAAEGAPAEEEVEIWRPAPRRPRAPHRPHGEREARPAQGKPHHRRHGRPQDGKPDEAAAAQAQPAQESRPAGDARPDSRPQGPRSPRPERRDEPRRFEGRPKDDRRDDRRPQKDFAPRRERPAQADPDSPFAKLAALKPLLERRDKRP